MKHPEHYDHQTAFATLAAENDLDSTTIACAERAFGNDFDLMQDALADVAPISLEEAMS